MTRPTGERVVTAELGWGPTWQRHVAAYALVAPLLPEGRVLDLGCGIGHSFELLAPRESVGVDLDPSVLEGQPRETAAADMRSLPFASGSFDSVLCVQAIEHVPDPERVLDETARVLRPGGVAVFVTPNRLTFARPDEIIDPYHYVEYDPRELQALMASRFQEVDVCGLFGSSAYTEIFDAEREALAALLRRDPFKLRRLLARRVRRRLYDWRLRRAREHPDPRAQAITPDDFELRADDLDRALDLVGVGRRAG